MLKRHKLEFFKAVLLLSTIKEDSARLDLLLELQRHLIKLIFATEKKLNRTKGARGRLKARKSGHLSKEQAGQVRRLVAAADERVVEYRRLMFFWRAFGDGIASIYQSPYALKYLYFDEKYKIKQDAGFLSGKSGLKREWRVVRFLLGKDVPVVLSDLTNMIRVGDVCVLADEDPYPIEIKSGSYQGARRGRQEAHISALLDFYNSDIASSFLGIPNVRRIVLPTCPSYESEANACIAECIRDGVGMVELEPGLKYIAVKSLESFHEHVQPHAAMLVHSLTPDANWVPCYPFTLSLRPSNLWSFLNREVAFFVLIDMLQLKKLFAANGVDAIMVMDQVSAIQICPMSRDFEDPTFRISELLFARVGMEFQSLAWFAEAHSKFLFDEQKIEFAPIDPSDAPLMLERGELVDMSLLSWEDAKDFWDGQHLSKK